MKRLELLLTVALAAPLFLVLTPGCSSDRSWHHGSHENAEEAIESNEAMEAEEEEGEAEVIALNAAPAPVQEAIRRVAGSIQPSKVMREEADEQIEFEIEYQKDGHACSLRTTEAGTVLEIEEGIAQETVPAAVLHSIQHKYPKSRIEASEVVHEFHYEFELMIGGKKHMVSVSPNGVIDDESESK